jgi:formylglycine-generating enzyme required for sulfatase activity
MMSSLLLVLALLATPQGEPDRARGPERQRRSVYPEMPEGAPPVLPVENAGAATAEEMKPYTELVPGADATLDLVPIPGGSFVMGSPDSERKRKKDEGPQHAVALEPFWMGTTEITWDAYHAFMFKRDIERRSAEPTSQVEQDAWADAVSRPTPPYVPMDFEMGVDGCPAVCMTQFAARQYTKWLSMKTGRFYRLPTEAEWEYACRAGTTTAYSFGDDPQQLDEHAWYFDNADDTYHPVAEKKPNPWGLFDMHGNVAEWVLDRHDADFYATVTGAAAANPLAWPTDLYPRVVRGGSWDDDADRLRAAARRPSSKGWKVQDPQMPKSIWYHTDATFVGFRIVRPLREPSDEQKLRYWEADLDAVRKIQQKQRTGGR